MNEHGLAIVIFTASGTEVETDGKKIPLSNHSLYRAIIDRCKTVSEALEFLIPGDENYSVVFNLTKRTATVEFAPDFAVRHRYQL